MLYDSSTVLGSAIMVFEVVFDILTSIIEFRIYQLATIQFLYYNLSELYREVVQPDNTQINKSMQKKIRFKSSYTQI